MRLLVRSCVPVVCAVMASACATTPADRLRGGAPDRSESDVMDGELPETGELAETPVVDETVPDLHAGDASSTEGTMGIAAAAAEPITVFVNGGGGTYTAGRDNAPSKVSSVLQYYGKSSVTLPASAYTGAKWQELMSCVKSLLAPYNVVVTDTKPAGGYTELVVSSVDATTALGLSKNVGGVAPLGSCRVVPLAVGYVFQRLYDQPGYGGVRGVCEAAAHEIGHSFSLSHEQLASDLMSYSATNGSKKFQDAASACGVAADRVEKCSCGGPTQNSHEQLLTLVGASRGASPAPSPTPPPGEDSVAPKLAIVSPQAGAKLAGSGAIEVIVDATDETSLASVALGWEYTNRTLPCDASTPGVTCTKDGARHTWSINVGTGARSFHAIAKDAAGNTTRTPSITIELTGAAPAPVADAPPTIAVELPEENQTYAPGSALVFRASVKDDVKVADVRAVWITATGSIALPMTEAATPGVYEARTTLSGSARAGTRSVEIQATDDKGQRTVSPRRTVVIQ